MLFFHYICSSLPAQYLIVSTVFDTVFFKYTWSMTSCVLSLNTISTCTTNSMSYNDGNNLICVYFSLFFTLTLCIFFITNLTRLILSIHKMVYLFLVQLSLKMCSCGENIFRHWKTSWHLVYLINYIILYSNVYRSKTCYYNFSSQEMWLLYFYIFFEKVTFKRMHKNIVPKYIYRYASIFDTQQIYTENNLFVKLRLLIRSTSLRCNCT